MKDQFEGKIFPEVPTSENIEDSIGQPLFVVFRTLCEISEIDPNRQPILAGTKHLLTVKGRVYFVLIDCIYQKLGGVEKFSLFWIDCIKVRGKGDI